MSNASLQHASPVGNSCVAQGWFPDINTLTGKVTQKPSSSSSYKQLGPCHLAGGNQLIAASYLPWHASATQNANYDFMAILFFEAPCTTISLPPSPASGLCGSWAAGYIDYWTRMWAVEAATIN